MNKNYEIKELVEDLDFIGFFAEAGEFVVYKDDEEFSPCGFTSVSEAEDWLQKMTGPAREVAVSPEFSEKEIAKIATEVSKGEGEFCYSSLFQKVFGVDISVDTYATEMAAYDLLTTIIFDYCEDAGEAIEWFDEVSREEVFFPMSDD